MSENTINRRKVTKGLAWSVPTAVAVVAAPMAAASPTLCDTRDLWMNQIPLHSFYNTSIDADGVITITPPETWVDAWPPNITISYIGTDAKATLTRKGNAVIATPPAGVDPFDIKMLESQNPAGYRSVFREEDEAGNYLCSLGQEAWDWG